MSTRACTSQGVGHVPVKKSVCRFEGSSWKICNEGRPVARAEFRYILSRAASVYANSQYTRSILQSVYGVRCPVIYSVPRELERRDEA